MAIDCGVDVAQGWEAGGHVWGTVATMALVPAVVDEVAPVPVIAAGGIADGRGMAAALALGAAGVWIGTRFLASAETNFHPRYQERLLGASENDTIYLDYLFDGGARSDAPARVLRNKTVASWEAAGRPQKIGAQGQNEVVAVSASKGGIKRYVPTAPIIGNETIGRAPMDLTRIVELDERPLAQYGNPCRERHRFLLVVRDEDEGLLQLTMKPLLFGAHVEACYGASYHGTSAADVHSSVLRVKTRRRLGG